MSTERIHFGLIEYTLLGIGSKRDLEWQLGVSTGAASRARIYYIRGDLSLSTFKDFLQSFQCSSWEEMKGGKCKVRISGTQITHIGGCFSQGWFKVEGQPEKEL